MNNQCAINSHRYMRGQMRKHALHWRKVKPRAKALKAKVLADAIDWRDAAADWYRRHWVAPFEGL